VRSVQVILHDTTRGSTRRSHSWARSATTRSRAAREPGSHGDGTPAVGLVGGRYHVLNELGRGGMGTVYRVLDRLTGRVVTLKRLHVPTDDDALAVRSALAQEFRLLASLRHPNIISVLDYGFDGERQPYFTMDLA